MPASPILLSLRKSVSSFLRDPMASENASTPASLIWFSLKKSPFNALSAPITIAVENAFIPSSPIRLLTSSRRVSFLSGTLAIALKFRAGLELLDAFFSRPNLVLYVHSFGIPPTRSYGRREIVHHFDQGLLAARTGFQVEHCVFKLVFSTRL